MKRTLSLILCLVMALGVFSIGAGALGSDVYVLTGGSDWFDGWSPKVNRNVMKKQSDGTYSKTVSHVPASGNRNYALKVVCFKNGDENEDIWIGADGTDYNYEFRVTSECDVTVTYNPATKKITATGSGVAEANYTINKITATGDGKNGFLNNISWDPDAEDNKMTEVSPGVYEIEYTGVKANVEYQVKFAANGGWNLNWGCEDDAEVVFGTPLVSEFNSSGNITFTPESDAAAVSVKLRLDLTKWDPLSKKGATFTVWVDGEASASDDLSVSGVSNYCLGIHAQSYQVGETVTVVFPAPENCDIVDLSWGMDFNKNKLGLTGISTIAPEDMVIKAFSDDTYDVIGNVTLTGTPCHVNKGDDFMTFVFNAKAQGEASVDLRIIDMTVREGGSKVTVFEDEGLFRTIKYDLWVGDTQVTSDNRDDILNNGGKAKFDPSTATLTLNKASVTGYHTATDGTASIYADGMDLTVKGSGTIGSNTVGTGLFLTDSSLMGSYTLTLNGDFTFKGEYGAASMGTLNIDGGTITSTGTMIAYGDLKVNAGLRRLEVSGGNGTFGSFGGKLILDPSLKITLPEGGKVKDWGIVDANGQAADHIVITGKASGILGDAEGDGEVTILDATFIQRKLASLPVESYNEAAADTDGDGEVTILDATYIQRYLAGLSCPEGIGKPIA